MHYIISEYVVCKSNFYTKNTKICFLFCSNSIKSLSLCILFIIRQWNNPWPLNVSVTECLDHAVYVPVGEGLVLQDRLQQEVVCFEDTQLQQKYDQDQEAGYHPCIITIIYCILPKVQTIVFPTRREEVLELLAGK